MKKENKGITLIALIITIIVLLILAVVTISAVNEGSIFAHANNAATRYNAAATEENSLLTNYLVEMALHDGEAQNPQGEGEGEEEDSIVGTYTNIPDSSINIILNDDNTWSFSTVSDKYEYENNVLSIIYNNSVIGQCNVVKINGTTAFYSDAMTFGGFLFAKDPSKIERSVFSEEKSEITCKGWKYIFRTDGTYGRYQGTTPTTDNDGNYGIYSGFEDYILIGSASTDWYKFTSDTTMESLNG